VLFRGKDWKRKEDKLARWKKGAVYYGTSCPIHAERPCMCRLEGIQIMLQQQNKLREEFKKERVKTIPKFSGEQIW
jgi:hypothetical protein